MDFIIGIIGLILFIAVLITIFSMKSDIEAMKDILKYITKYISYKEVYYCPMCLQLSRKASKCPKCSQEMVKK